MGAGGPLQIDFQRYRYGKTRSKLSPAVQSAEIIRIGSLTRLDGGVGGDIKMLSSITIPGVAATPLAARQLAHDEFFGNASQRSLDGEVQPLRHNCRGVHEYKAAAGAYPVGQLVGPADDGAQLLDNTVVPVANPDEAIGRVAEDAGTNPESVLVDIVSSINEGGVQAIL